MKFGVIKTGGKQYVVTPGQKLEIEKLEAADGASITFPALLLADGENVEVGKPLVKIEIPAKVLTTAKGVKVDVIKFKSKVRYRRTKGHRQIHTKVEIGTF